MFLYTNQIDGQKKPVRSNLVGKKDRKSGAGKAQLTSLAALNACTSEQNLEAPQAARSNLQTMHQTLRKWILVWPQLCASIQSAVETGNTKAM